MEMVGLLFIIIYNIAVYNGSLPYTGKFSRSQIFANWSEIRCEPYKLFDLCV